MVVGCRCLRKGMVRGGSRPTHSPHAHKPKQTTPPKTTQNDAKKNRAVQFLFFDRTEVLLSNEGRLVTCVHPYVCVYMYVCVFVNRERCVVHMYS